MNTEHLKTAVLALGVAVFIFAGGVVGTGAVSVGADTLFEDGEPNVVMVPHDGPGGQYVVETDDSQLAVDFSDPGLTRNAELEFHRVFDLVNEDEETVIVWITHESEDVLRLYDDATGETLAGKSNAVAIDPGKRLTVSVDVDSRGVTGDELVTPVTFAAEFDIPFFEVDIVGIDESVVAGQTIDVEAVIENIGNAASEEGVRFLVDGEVVDDLNISLGPGEQGTVEFEYETIAEDIGNQSVVVETDDDRDEREVIVEPTEDPFFEVTIDDIDEEVDVGDRLVIETTVENVGRGSDTQSIELVVDDDVVDGRSVDLDGDESASILLAWTPEESDEGTDVPVVVRSEDGEDTATVDVNAVLAAQASASSYAVSVGSEVEFRAERTIAPPGVTPSYNWTLDDEHLAEGEIVSTVLSEPGEREVTLTATADGRVDTDTITIDVEDETPPTADLVVDETVGLGDSITFDASGSTDNVEIDHFVWDFGDGTTRSGTNLDMPSHTYDAPGRYTVTLTVVDTSGNEARVTERIVVESPLSALSTGDLDFEQIGTGSTSGLTVRINNTGTTDLEMSDIGITGADAEMFELVGDADDGSLIVEPGDTHSIVIEFSPTTSGIREATLVFDSNNPTPLGNVSLTGSGIEGTLAPVESTIDFGDVPADTSEQRMATVENTGDDAVEITGTQITGDDADVFELVDGETATIEPGETHDVAVAFEPTAKGDRTATLRIISEEATVSVVLRGTGEAPRIRLSPDEIRYRTVGISDRSNTGVEIRNTGSEPLNIDAVDVTSDDSDTEQFRIDSDTVPATIAPGETEPFEFWFEPEVDGEHTATLTVESNDPEEPTTTVPVTGEAVGADIGIDRRTVDFGETGLNQTVYMSVTIKNKDDSLADLTIEEIDIVGKDPGAFFINDGEAPMTLKPGESRQIEIGFEPLAVRPMEAQLRILSDAGNRPIMNVWLSNTRTYIIVQEVGNPTVNVEGYNLAIGGEHEIDVWTPNVNRENVGFQALNFTTVRSGNFEMNIDHGETPRGPTFETIGESPIQYVELDHFETDSDLTFTDTGLRYQVSKTSIPSGTGPENVTLYRWNDDTDEWIDLTDNAELVDETSTHYVFEMDTPGFSQFAVTVPEEDGDVPPDEGTDEDDGTDDDSGGPTGPGGRPSDGPADDPSDDSDAGPTDPDQPAEDIPIQTNVDFGIDGAVPAFEAREVSPEEIRELDRETADQPPRAIIHPREDQGTSLEENRTVSIGGEQVELSADHVRIITASEPIKLSGERSTVSTSDSITEQDRMVGAVEIDVPDGRRDQPATIQLRMSRDRFGDSSPESATIGHRTEEGWELLSTEVVDAADDEVILSAETPSFSVFGIFADPQVQYEWTLPDESAADGSVLSHTFEEPGLYEVELRITDAFDREAATTYQVLANDVPEATIEVVERDGEEVTLAASVDNEIGEVEEITWTFPNGTELTGEEVTHTLEDGEYEIGIHVVDEFGAEFRMEESVAIGTLPQAVADALGVDLEFLVQLSLVSILCGAFTVGYRQFPWSIFSSIGRRRPEITVFENPFTDTVEGQFVIEKLTVVDSGNDLDTITIEINESDGTVIRKRIDVSGRGEYSSSPETLVIPPGVEIDPEREYTVRIEAIDSNGRRVGTYSTISGATETTDGEIEE